MIKVGHFSISSTGTVDITDVGFEPGGYIIWWRPSATNNFGSMGAGASDGSSSFAVVYNAQFQGATRIFARNSSNSNCILVINQNNTIQTRASHSAFLSNGFRLSVTTASTPHNFSYMAFSKDVDMKVTNFSIPSTGTQNVAGHDFQPAGGLFFWRHSSSSNTVSYAMGGTDGSSHFGAALNATNPSSPNYASRATTAHPIRVIASNGNTVTQAGLSSFLSNGYSLNVATATSSQNFSSVMFGGNVKVGNFSLGSGASIFDINGVGFEPQGVVGVTKPLTDSGTGGFAPSLAIGGADNSFAQSSAAASSFTGRASGTGNVFRVRAPDTNPLTATMNSVNPDGFSGTVSTSSYNPGNHNGFGYLALDFAESIEVSSIEQLDAVRDGLHRHYFLTRHLDFNDDDSYDDPENKSDYTTGQGWIPIGDRDDRFTGTFDGQGHVVKNLFMEQGNDMLASGLFGSITQNAEIKNIGLIDPSVNAEITTDRTDCGALVGEVSAVNSSSNPKISNCFSAGGKVGGDDTVGGLIGSVGVLDGTIDITDCYSTTDVEERGTFQDGLGLGGLVGLLFADGGTVNVDRCYSAGDVTAGDPQDVGGLVGNVTTVNSGTVNVENSFWDTETSGQATSPAGAGKTTSEMQDIDTYTDTGTTGLDTAWDMVLRSAYIDETWFIRDGEDYPRLGWELLHYTLGNVLISWPWEVSIDPHMELKLALDIVWPWNSLAIVSTIFQQLPQKEYAYHVTSPDGTYLGVWQDVTSEFAYDNQINQTPSALTVTLGRSPNNLVQDVVPLLDEDSQPILDENNSPILTPITTKNSVGPGTDVDLNYTVDVFAYYGGFEALLDENGEQILDENGSAILVPSGHPGGIRVYSGYIFDYELDFGGDQGVSVTVVPFAVETDNLVYRDNEGNTEVAHLSEDPGQMYADALDYYQNQGGVISYNSLSLELPGTTSSYTFRLQTIREVGAKAVELIPEGGWYHYFDPGTNLAHLHPTSQTPHHTFALGYQISGLRLKRTMDGLTNEVYFTGKEDDDTGLALFTYTSDAPSLSQYPMRGLQRISDGRVDLDTSALALSQNRINLGKEPRYESTLVINDEDYDIETIQTGEVVGFSNFDSFVDDITMQIADIKKRKHTITLILGKTQKRTTKRLEEIKRNILSAEASRTGAAPETE